MRATWIVVVMVSGWCGAVPAGWSESIPSGTAGWTVEAVAAGYPTPNALARFLKESFTFQTDEELFGEPDHWQTPEAFLARRAGDCEDYALFVQAVLKRQGIHAEVLSVYGEDGYAHTVCVFRRGGRYEVINEDRLRMVGAKTLEELAWVLYSGWTYAAICEQRGSRGKAIRLMTNPTPATGSWRSDSLLSFP